LLALMAIMPKGSCTPVPVVALTCASDVALATLALAPSSRPPAPPTALARTPPVVVAPLVAESVVAPFEVRVALSSTKVVTCVPASAVATEAPMETPPDTATPKASASTSGWSMACRAMEVAVMLALLPIVAEMVSSSLALASAPLAATSRPAVTAVALAELAPWLVALMLSAPLLVMVVLAAIPALTEPFFCACDTTTPAAAPPPTRPPPRAATALSSSAEILTAFEPWPVTSASRLAFTWLLSCEIDTAAPRPTRPAAPW